MRKSQDFHVEIRVVWKPQRISERLSRHNYGVSRGINNVFIVRRMKNP